MPLSFENAIVTRRHFAPIAATPSTPNRRGSSTQRADESEALGTVDVSHEQTPSSHSLADELVVSGSEKVPKDGSVLSTILYVVASDLGSVVIDCARRMETSSRSNSALAGLSAGPDMAPPVVQDLERRQDGTG